MYRLRIADTDKIDGLVKSLKQRLDSSKYNEL